MMTLMCVLRSSLPAKALKFGIIMAALLKTNRYKSFELCEGSEGGEL